MAVRRKQQFNLLTNNENNWSKKLYILEDHSKDLAREFSSSITCKKARTLGTNIYHKVLR